MPASADPILRPPIAGLLRPSRALLAFGVVLVVAIAAFVAHAGWTLREQALASATRNLANLDQVLSEQTLRSLGTVELVLDDATERLRRIGDAGAVRGSAPLQMLLRDRVAALPQVERLIVLDRNGRLILDTTRFPSPPAALADAPYFAVHFDRGPRTAVTPGECDFETECVFHLSRRVDGPKGELVAVVAVAVRASRYAELYRGLDLGVAGHVLLATRDGVPLVEHRTDQTTVEPVFWVPPLPDGEERIVARRELTSLGLAVEASMSRDAVFDEWAAQMRMLAAGAGSVAMLLLALIGVLSRQLSRREHSETALRDSESRMRHLVNFDTLTGIANRNLFNDRLAAMLERVKRENRNAALLLIDLDRFKTINDTLGHRVGDELLRQVARRLERAIGEDDIVARLGGDEFVVLLEERAGEDRGAEVAERLLVSLAQPFALEDGQYHVTASVGVARYPRDCDSAEALLARADIAMYRAKDLGKNGWQAYVPQMGSQAGERLELESALRQALARGEFLLHYQPKIDLATNRITGAEALVRWQHPERGLLSPGVFIELAEETGVIVPLGRWVLEEACRQAKAWQQAGLPPLRIAVNLSARQFADSGLLDDVRVVLRDTGLPPSALELEITESMVMGDPEKAVHVLSQLKAMGIALSIDDFGTGYSSLSYLKRFPIDGLKIDRSFIRDIPDDADDVAITRTVIAMARSLRLKVIAEGVETRAQLAFLREHRCSEVQGYLFAKPLGAAAFEAWVRAYQPARFATLERGPAAAALPEDGSASASRTAAPDEDDARDVVAFTRPPSIARRRDAED